MQRKTDTVYYRILTTLIVLNLSGGFVALPQAGQKAPPPASKKNRPPVDDFLDPRNPPLTLAKLVDLLNLVRQGIQTEGRILKGVEARGVDFLMTPANSQALAAAGASVKLLELLETKAPAPPSPPPPPKEDEKPTGLLRLQCEPAECEISLNGGPFLSTTNGTRAFPGLRLGEAVADFRKSGYVGQHLPVVVSAGAGKALVVKLEPDQVTQAAFGNRLFNALMNAAGRDANQVNPPDLFASGSATIFDPAGSGTEWNITAAFEAARNTFDVKSSSGEMKLECRGETCQAQPGGKLFAKRLSHDQMQNLETTLRQFQKYHFAVLLDRFVANKVRPLANAVNIPPAGEQQLRLETDSEAYDVSLNKELLPSMITFKSKAGVGSGLSVAFADYTAVGKSRYPRTTEIKLPDGKQGLRVHFEQLSPSRGK